MQDDPSDKARVIALPPLILTGVLVLGFVLDLARSGHPCHPRRDRPRSFGGPADGPRENSGRCPQTNDGNRDLRRLPIQPQSNLSQHGRALPRRRFPSRFALVSGSLRAARNRSAKGRYRTGRSLSRTKIWSEIPALQSQGRALVIDKTHIPLARRQGVAKDRVSQNGRAELPCPRIEG